jgi:cellulose synthase/poly-beta-1,6-N-acetylglucosamine synthase-like glycosyltransferase
MESAPVVAAQTATAISVALAAHTAYNLTQLREPLWDGTPITEKVSILIPARNEEVTIRAAAESALAQIGLTNFEILILDDSSSDNTAHIVSELAEAHADVTLMRGTEDIPPGWLGKPFACHRLAQQASGSVLVFLDADVTLEPTAVAACVQLLREQNLALIAPYPRQIAESLFERLVQPLVVWSWAATLPLGIAEKSLRPSLSAANGQLMVMDRHAYVQCGGHESVRDIVLEDIALMRSLKASGSHCATVNGADIAQCRMYESTEQVIDGYTKSLWSAFGSPAGSVAVNSLLGFSYLVPPIALITGRNRSTRILGGIGLASGIASRALVAKKTNAKVWPDSLAQPASIAAFIGLNALSWYRHVRGTNTWKGRSL